MWRFDPVLQVEVERNDNVLLAGPATGVADNILTADIRLALIRETARSALELSYRPIREFYDASPDLDNTTQILGISYAREMSTRSAWDFAAGWSRFERQRLDFETPDAELITVPRTQTDALTARFSGRWGTGTRGRMLTGLTYLATSYARDVIAVDADGDGTADPNPLEVDDIATVTLSGGYETDLSSRTATRLRYVGSRIDSGFRGTTDVHRVLVGVTRGRPERTQWILDLGMGKAKIVDPGRPRPGDAPVPVSDLRSPTSGVGSLSLRFRAFRRGELLFGAARDFTATGGTSGAAVSTTFFGTLRVPVARRSYLAFFGRRSERDPIDAGVLATSATTTSSYRAEWGASLGRAWHVVTAGESVTQRSDTASLDGDYNIWSLGLRWSPLAERGR